MFINGAISLDARFILRYTQSLISLEVKFGYSLSKLTINSLWIWFRLFSKTCHSCLLMEFILKMPTMAGELVLRELSSSQQTAALLGQVSHADHQAL